ncbi:MAG: ATP-binding protein [Candidatus Korobacteraceae bacterium]
MRTGCSSQPGWSCAWGRGRRLVNVGAPDSAGRSEYVLRNLRFDLSQRKVLLVFDEAQHLSIECLETLRELLDQPPHCGLLFAGTHELEEIFTRQALELEQSAHSVKPFSYSAKHFG